MTSTSSADALQRKQSGRGPLELAEEALHLVRQCPWPVLACYYIGSMPMVIGLLYFIADMSQNFYAQQRVVAEALALAGLFVWAKTWHAIFARGMLDVLHGQAARTWSPRTLVRVAVAQTIVQPWGLIVLWAPAIILPFSFDNWELVRMPLVRVPLWLMMFMPVAFFENVTVLCGQSSSSPAGRGLRAIVGQSWHQAMLWPYQNMMGLGLLRFMTRVLDVNLAMVLAMLPWLLQSVLGVETVFSRSGWALVLNTTFWSVVLCLSYLLMDPLVKAFYVLRCFYGLSLRTAADLRAQMAQSAADASQGPIGARLPAGRSSLS